MLLEHLDDIRSDFFVLHLWSVLQLLDSRQFVNGFPKHAYIRSVLVVKQRNEHSAHVLIGNRLLQDQESRRESPVFVSSRTSEEVNVRDSIAALLRGGHDDLCPRPKIFGDDTSFDL